MCNHSVSMVVSALAAYDIYVTNHMYITRGLSNAFKSMCECIIVFLQAWWSGAQSGCRQELSFLTRMAKEGGADEFVYDAIHACMPSTMEDPRNDGLDKIANRIGDITKKTQMLKWAST